MKYIDTISSTLIINCKNVSIFMTITNLAAFSFGGGILSPHILLMKHPIFLYFYLFVGCVVIIINILIEF
jgi:hypothetical protein